MIFLTLEQIIEIHDQLIQDHGGKNGVLNLGLLISAIEMPKTTMDGLFLHPTIYDQAAAYLFHIVKNHAFVDGNKRTAVACSLIFLHQNEHPIDFDSEHLDQLVCGAVKGEFDKSEISKFFKECNF